MTMARLILVVLLAVLLPRVSFAQTTPRLRVLDSILRSTFEHGIAQSPTLRELVAKIDLTSVLVFVDCELQMPERIGAQLNFVTTVNGVRYVRVTIGCALAPRRQVALLAHELQHALEIGERPDITDVDTMESFYDGTGFQSFENGTHKGFETDAALAIQQRVEEEMGRRLSRSPEHSGD